MEIINHRKAKKPAANCLIMKKHIFILLIFSYLFALIGCSSINNELIPTYNKGGYKIKIIKSAIKSDEVIIKGKVFDVDTGIPISDAHVILGCIKIKTSSQGEYSFKTKNSTYKNYFIEVIYIGYKSIITNYIDLTDQKERKIDFYLVPDDRPLINCEGVNYK